MSLEDELTVKEVAYDLGVTYITTLKYIKQGYIPAIWRGGRWNILRADLERFRKEGAPKNTPGGATNG